MKPVFPFPSRSGVYPLIESEWKYIGHFNKMDVYVNHKVNTFRRVYEASGEIRTRTNAFGLDGPRETGFVRADIAYRQAWERLRDPSISPNATHAAKATKARSA